MEHPFLPVVRTPFCIGLRFGRWSFELEQVSGDEKLSLLAAGHRNGRSRRCAVPWLVPVPHRSSLRSSARGLLNNE